MVDQNECKLPFYSNMFSFVKSKSNFCTLKDIDAPPPLPGDCTLSWWEVGGLKDVRYYCVSSFPPVITKQLLFIYLTGSRSRLFALFFLLYVCPHMRVYNFFDFCMVCCAQWPRGWLLNHLKPCVKMPILTRVYQ